MTIIAPIITILAILAILLIAQQTRLGARDAAISQAISFSMGGEMRQVFMLLTHYGLFVKTKSIACEGVRARCFFAGRRGLAGFYPIAPGQPAPRMIAEVQLPDLAALREFCRALVGLGYAYSEFCVCGTAVRFYAKNC